MGKVLQGLLFLFGSRVFVVLKIFEVFVFLLKIGVDLLVDGFEFFGVKISLSAIVLVPDVGLAEDRLLVDLDSDGIFGWFSQ